MHYMALAQLLILLSLANGSPVIAKLILGEAYATPIDGNTQFIDGRPLFGRSKTIRGVVVSLLVTALVALLIGLQVWTAGGRRRHGRRPVVKLLEAPVRSRTQ